MLRHILVWRAKHVSSFVSSAAPVARRCQLVAAHVVAVAALGTVMLSALQPLVVNAAVPIEESVEAAGRAAAQQAQDTRSPELSPPRRARGDSLNIPQTIEPPASARSAAPRPITGSTSEQARTVGGVLAAAPVGEQSGTQGGNSAGLSQLFYKIQVLEQEVQLLRGQLEEQTHLVQRLQRDQKEQYVDLDQRIVALGTGATRGGGGQPSAGAASTGGSSSGAGVGANLPERELYTAAFNAMRARDFETSLQGFTQLIERFPNGQYTPNAYYWIGELQLVGNTDAEAARQSFMQVINLYPDHQKAPDSLYKLGVSYHNLGDVETARLFLRRVQQEYPDSAAANLAAKYAAELPP